MEHRIKRRGLSDVVTTVLIILVAIVAVGIVGVVVNNFIRSGSNQITTQTQCQNLVLNPVSCKWAAGTATVVYNRGAGEAPITGVKLILTNTDGTSAATDATASPVIGELEGKTQAIPAAVKPVNFAVAGVITQADGYTKLCQQSQATACS